VADVAGDIAGEKRPAFGRWHQPARVAQPLRLCAGLAVSAGCLVVASRSVQIRELWSIMRSLPIWVVLLYLCAASSSLFLRAVRWRLLLLEARPVPAGIVFAVNSAGQMGNSLLPARLGDVFRATNLGRVGISSGFALATVFVERVLDTGFLVLLSAIALGTISAVPEWLARASRMLAGVACGGLAFALLAPLFEAPILSVAEVCVPRRWLAKFRRLVEQFVMGLRSLRHPRRVLGFVLLTVIIWSLDGAGAWAVGRGVGAELSPVLTVLLLTSVALASAVPLAPGNLGVYQMVAVAVLTPLGVAPARALALAVTLQFLIIANLLFWGLGSVWFLGASGHLVAPGARSRPPQ
jgi:uncharacterized protein (TIRG00374 family)